MLKNVKMFFNIYVIFKYSIFAKKPNNTQLSTEKKVSLFPNYFFIYTLNHIKTLTLLRY